MTRALVLPGALLLGIGCRQTGAEPPDQTLPGELETGVVIRIHDGDSGLLEFNGTQMEFRLRGINAPEREECHDDEARDHLAGLLGDGEVGVETNQIDQFGRALAYLWRGEIAVNLEMVAAGFAIATTPDDGDALGAAIVTAEEQAATERRGLWAEGACGGGGPLPPLAVDPGASSFDPSGPDDEALEEEWVSLTSEAAIDLEGWTVRDESSAHRCRLPRGSRVSPGSDLIVTSADECWRPGGSPVWDNGGDLVLVLDETGRVAAHHRYGD